MQDVVADLDPQPGADESSETGYVDRSIDTSIPLEPAEAEPEVKEEEPEIEAESPPADVGDVEEKTPGSAEERISELTRKWRETERENESTAAENARLKAELEAVSREPVQPFKSPDEFETTAEYNTYLAAEMDRRAEVAAQRAINDMSSKTKGEEIGEDFAKREKEFAKDVPDYFDLVYARDLKINEGMKEVIQTDEHGLDLAVYLGSNPDIAKDIFGMPPLQAGMKMSQLLADISASKAKAAETSTTKAPPPVPQIASTADVQLEKDPADMSDKEFAKWRRKQIANR
jgi:hypothetical protein